MGAKIKVMRVLENGHTVWKKYEVKSGKVIVKTGERGQGVKNYTPPYDPDCVRTIGLFKTKYVEYIDGADVLTSAKPEGKPPKYTARDIVRTVDVKLLEKQAKTPGQSTPLEIMMILMMVGIGFMVYLLILNSGVIQLG